MQGGLLTAGAAMLLVPMSVDVWFFGVDLIGLLMGLFWHAHLRLGDAEEGVGFPRHQIADVLLILSTRAFLA